MAKAQNGDPEAIVVASIMYLYGWNVEKNENLAFDMLFELAKNTQFPPALVLLGDIFDDHDEPEKALKCYRSAADQNYADGLMNLGRCYWYGIGCNVDGLKGVQLLEKSLGMGADDANYWLGMVYYFGSNEIKINEDLTFKYLSAASKNGIPEAMKYLGHCYYSGFGTEQDFDKAREYYLEAAKRGRTEAIVAYAFEPPVRLFIWERYILVDKETRDGLDMEHDDAAQAFSSMFIEMFENAKKNYIYDSQIMYDDIIALYDDTIIGAMGKKGFVITEDFEIISSKQPGKKYNIQDLSDDDIARLAGRKARYPLQIIRDWLNEV
jgi:tetratricopeptide (TPR) repeat protein